MSAASSGPQTRTQVEHRIGSACQRLAQ
jgi:hypothetical protein